MKFLFAGILAFCISCVFSIEIDQNIETDSDQPENLEDSDVSFGKYNFQLQYSKLVLPRRPKHYSINKHVLIAGQKILICKYIITYSAI